MIARKPAFLNLKKRNYSAFTTRISLQNLYKFIILVTLPLWSLATPSDKVNPLSSTKEYTLFTESHATLISNESEGPAAIGGNLYIGEATGNRSSAFAVYAGSFNVPGTSIPLALLVNGGVQYNRGTIRVLSGKNNQQRKGTVKIGNLAAGNGHDASVVHDRDQNGAKSLVRITKSGQTHSNHNALIELTGNADDFNFASNPVGFTPNSIINFPEVFNELRSNSLKLAKMESTVKLVDKRLYVLSPANDAANDPYIWNTDAATLKTMSEINLSITPTQQRPLIINVSTDSRFDFNIFNMNISSNVLPYILWNFPNVQEFNIVSGNTIEGSVLAPNAYIHKSGGNNIQGQVVANSFYQSTGELHNFPFQGLIAIPKDQEPAQPERVIVFGVADKKRVAEVIWETIDDRDSDHFIVERSQNSKDWQERGRVKTRRKDSPRPRYVYEDPMDSPFSTTFYYRLKIVNVDENVDNTHIESVPFIVEAPEGEDDQDQEFEQTPLPVRLVSFQVKNEQTLTQLKWETTEEVNSNYFAVERSSNSKDWSEIGRVGGAGNSTSQRYYTFEDNVSGNGKTFYYRLKMVDLDGTFDYSRIESISLNKQEASFTTSFYPNPVTDKLFIKNESSSAIQAVELYDLAGQRQLINTGNTSEIDVQNLREGIYIIAATYSNGKRQSSRIVIKK